MDFKLLSYFQENNHLFPGNWVHKPDDSDKKHVIFLSKGVTFTHVLIFDPIDKKVSIATNFNTFETLQSISFITNMTRLSSQMLSDLLKILLVQYP